MFRFTLDPYYSITRSYALKGKLLEFSIYEELVHSRTLRDIVERLRTTVYGEALSELPEPLRSEGLEKIFQTNLIDTEYSLIRRIPEARFLETYFLRHVYKNLKVILRSRAVPGTPIEVHTTLNLRAEEHLGIRDMVVRAMAERDLEGSVNALKGTPVYKDLLHALEVYGREKDPQILETSLDRSFYDQVLQALRKMGKGERMALLKLLAFEIDGYLVVTALRARFWNLTPAETRRFMISRGIRLDGGKVEGLARATKVEEVLSELEDTDYQAAVRLADPSQIQKTISSIEAWFREELLKRARRAFLEDIFKHSVIYSFVKLKEVEVRNLSAVAFGIEYGVPPPDILTSIVRVI